MNLSIEALIDALRAAADDLVNYTPEGRRVPVPEEEPKEVPIEPPKPRGRPRKQQPEPEPTPEPPPKQEPEPTPAPEPEPEPAPAPAAQATRTPEDIRALFTKLVQEGKVSNSDVGEILMDFGLSRVREATPEQLGQIYDRLAAKGEQ